jgi:hypothetical protein
MRKRFAFLVLVALLASCVCAALANAGTYTFPDGTHVGAPDSVVHAPIGVHPPSATAVAGSGIVLSATPDSLTGLEVTSGATAGFVLVFDSATVPGDGTVAPALCHQMLASTSWEMPIDPLQPPFFHLGVSVVYSSTGCFTKTASATAFISGQVSP